MKSVALSLGIVLLASPLLATCGGGGGGGVGGIPPGGGDLGSPRGLPADQLQVYRVPWVVLPPGNPRPAGLLTLYWFPTSAAEARASELVASRSLTLAAGHCVALVLVTSDNAALRLKYAAPADAALAVLAITADGSELGRAQPKHGPLDRAPVEKLLRDGLDRFTTATDQQLVAANARATKGDKEGAIALYTAVWDRRCLASKAARKAAKGLERLGHPVPRDARLDLPEPDPGAATTDTITRLLQRGLAAEIELRLADAQVAYADAHRADPGDPVPLRFLGELYRHHIGDWQEARQVFAQILAMPADPLSRAVALHGLGKMTIHDGQFAQGLDLFAQSLAAFPLALTYRNLAVYWSSEGAAAKAYGYVEQALAIDPDDEYNQIFAATFLVQLGQPEEAKRIAEQHDAVLAASYNLAAIWAQLGQRDKALALLRRHFYAYEQFAAVRAKEMQEARVDIVFASLKNDPAFVELTALADRAGEPLDRM